MFLSVKIVYSLKPFRILHAYPLPSWPSAPAMLVTRFVGHSLDQYQIISGFSEDSTMFHTFPRVLEHQMFKSHEGRNNDFPVI